MDHASLSMLVAMMREISKTVDYGGSHLEFAELRVREASSALPLLHDTTSQDLEEFLFMAGTKRRGENYVRFEEA